jgi:uncharacterized caspase-like protein/formylglycine-generating enzyme required for sulfatase activity
MKPLQIIVSLLLCALLTAPAHATQRNLKVTASNAQTQKRVALVIGNAAYQGAPALRNPVNDAKAMSDTLNGLGFEVIEVTDASQKEMNRAITAFGEKLSGETAALFFYAGHGLQVKGKNYIVPVDAEIKSESAIASETVSVDTVLEQLNASPISIVILDACRNNPFERSFRKIGGGGLAQMDAPKGSFIAYATAPGKTANDGDGKNGLFTQELLKQISVPGLDLEKVFKRVRSNVASKSGDAQMPWDSSSMTGDFYFKAGTGTQVASLEPVPAQPIQTPRVKGKDEIEQDSWDSVKDSGNVDAVKEYLKEYPKGRFAGQARILIATLKKSANKPAEAAAPTPPPVTTTRDDGETALWNEAQKGNSREDYQAYLDQYPKGKYVALAKSRIKKQQDEAQAAEEQQEQEVWQAAQDENSEASYGRYLKGYGNGRYAGLAKARQEKLKNDVAAKEEAELWRKAESGKNRQALEAYLNRYPAGRYVAAASEKLRALKEEEGKGPAMVAIPGRNYEMGKYDVTQKEWREVMGNNPSHFSSCGDTCPVEQVSWNDIQEFLSKLNAKTGRQYRLPSETEWEYACYGGSKTEYCGGNDINAVAWYDGNSKNQTHPAGQKQANGYGLYDMSGNVWQWMENKYDSENDWRALRGGSWYHFPQYVRAAYRNFNGPAIRYYYYGFRLARTLP